MSSKTTSVGAVIVAAGRGTRVDDGDPTPKQFRQLGVTTVLAQAVAPFARHVDEVVVVVSADARELATKALGHLASTVRLVDGGADRRASTRAGLAACTCEFVHVHDAARPFVTPELIERVEAGLGDADGVIPVLRPSDTVKTIEADQATGTVPRGSLGLAQTPQFFRRDALVAAHDAATDNGDYTDDASIIEHAGGTVRVVEGDHGNRKPTVAADFPSESSPPARPGPDIRVGHGYDTHRTRPGDAVVLCGVVIPSAYALDGHSDADVGIHALVDALLGTCGLGDIGTHFPPSDERWRDASSDQFLRHAVELVRRKRGTLTCADVTLVCETPKIGPHATAMRERLAALLNCSLDRVSVKATTNERIGFIGRGEGVVALATATVRYD